MTTFLTGISSRFFSPIVNPSTTGRQARCPSLEKVKLVAYSYFGASFLVSLFLIPSTPVIFVILGVANGCLFFLFVTAMRHIERLQRERMNLTSETERYRESLTRLDDAFREELRQQANLLEEISYIDGRLLKNHTLQPQHVAEMLSRGYQCTSSLSMSMRQLGRKLRDLSDSTCSLGTGICITSNESDTKKVKEALEQAPRAPKSVHVGFFGMHNLDIMAIRKSCFGLICDFNPKNKIFVEKILELLKIAPTRAIFVEKMCEYVGEFDRSCNWKNTFFLPKITTNDELLTFEEEVRRESIREGSWLASDSSYAYIRAMARSECIVAISADIRDTERFKTIMALFKEHGMQIDTLYLGNVIKWMYSSAGEKAYTETVHALTASEALIVGENPFTTSQAEA